MKKFMRLVAILLTFTIMVQTFPITGTLAVQDSELESESITQLSEIATELIETDEVEDPPEMICEDTEKRDETTKHFLRSDGSYVAVQYSGKVHYQPEGTDDWEDIDNTLVEYSTFGRGGESHYSPKSSPVDVAFPSSFTSESKISYDVNGHNISWRYIPDFSSLSANTANINTINTVNAVVEQETAVLLDENIEADVTVLEKLDSTLTYNQLFNNVDLKYTVTPNGVKEDLILKSALSDNSFLIEYNIGELTAQQESANEIQLLDENNEAVVFLTAPYMYDSNENYSASLEYEIVAQKNGVLIVELIADKSWLGDDERVYPVTIDPYIREENTNIANDVTVRYAGGTSCPAGSLVVGKNIAYQQCRSFIKFDLPTLLSGDMVTGGVLRLAQFGDSYGYSTSDTMQINIGNVLSTWDEDSLENTQGFSGLPSCSTTILDYTTTSYSSAFVWREFDVSKSVKDWYNGALVNNGLYLWSNSESTTAATIFASANYGTETYKPALYIYYLNNKGIEDRWTYHSQSAGESGTSYINDYTGNLIFTAPVTGTAGNLLPVSTSLVYNGYQAGQYVEGQGKSGLGWRFDFSQKINAITSGASDLYTKLYESGFRYIYTDSDGTEHYFTQIGTTNTYQDEEGMGLTLEVLSVVNASYEKYILSYESGEKVSFQSSGAIRRIYNTDGKYIEYTYDSTKLKRITDGAGQNIVFTFDTSNRVTQVTDPAGRNTTFIYNDLGELTKITYPNEKTTQFTYADNKLATVTCTDGYVLQYGYNTSGLDSSEKSKVISVTEKGRNGTEGGSLSIAYTYNNCTIFTDKEGRKETYQFDNVGRTVCIIDADGGASRYEYSSSSLKNKNANKLLSSSSATKHVDNMLINHSFENGTNNWTLTGSVSATSSTENPYLGNKSLKMSQTTSGGMTAYQRIPLSPGNYTLSVYIKTDSATTNSNIFVNCLNNWTSVGSFSSEKINETTDYRRLTVSFTAPAETNYANIAIYTSGTGTAWFDCIQLEKGSVVNDYNMLENSGFENTSSSAWITSGISSSDGVKSFSSGGNYYELAGVSTTTPNIRQTVYINRKASETFLSVSGNARANSVPIRDTRYYAMDIKTTFTDGTYVYNIVSFNPDVTGWQSMSEVIGYTGENASKTIASVTFYVIYYRNANKSYYDSFSLNIDKTGTTYTYDSDGNLISAKDNAGRNQTYKYNNVNEVTNVETADNKNYEYEYDESNPHRLVSATSLSSNIRFAYDYDSNGNVIKSKVMAVNADGSRDTSQKLIQTETTYTSDGNYVASQKDAAGKVTTYNYDTAKGTLSSVTDPKGNTTSYTYDADDDKLKSVTSGDSTINYEYADTTTDYLLEIRGETASYSFTYDEFGNTVSTNVGTQSLMTNTYEAGNGNLSESTYGNGDKITYVYDVYDRIAQKKYNDVIKYYWYYNAKGAVGKHIDNENGKTYTYEYDLLGRIQRVHISDGSFIESAYNNIDLSTGMTYGFGGTTKTVGYSYSDKDNMPESVTLPNSTAITNSYDKIGRVTSVNYGDAFSYEYTYQDVDSEKTTGLVSSMTVLQDMPMYLYQYDNNGNIVAFGYANHDGTGASVRETYEYDSLNQLIRTNSLLQNATWVYDYDDGGNILSKTKYEYTTESDLTGLTPVETINYTYGNENWGDLLTSYNGKAITYDAIGNPLTYDGWTYTWKNGRKLATASNGTNTLSYKYNADGIRTSKTVNGITTEYFLNGTQIIAQKTGNDIMWFYYDHDGKRIALEYQGAMYYYIYNLQGDVVAIADSNGTICGSYEYNDWGKIIDISNIGSNTVATANPFRYRGYYYDSETELYYLNSRYYNPEWGRFVNADAVTDGGAGILGYNLFIYAANDPINNADFTGNGVFKKLVKWYVKTKAAPITTAVKTILSKTLVGTRTKGVTLGLDLGIVSVSATFGASIDNKGNVAFQFEKACNLSVSGSFNASIAVTSTTTNAPTVDKLGDDGFSAGVSAFVPVYGVPVGGNVEMNLIPDTEANTQYYGTTTSLGVAAAPGAGFYGGWSDTDINEDLSFNIFSTLEETYIKIMEW